MASYDSSSHVSTALPALGTIDEPETVVSPATVIRTNEVSSSLQTLQAYTGSSCESAWQRLFEEKDQVFKELGWSLSPHITNESSFRAALKAKCDEFSNTLFSRIIGKMGPGFHHIKSFAVALGAVAQVHMFSNIAWGSLYTVIECGCKFGEALETITDLLESMAHAIPIFDVNLALFPDEEILQYPLREIFNEYCEFSIFTIKYFSKSSSRRFLQGAITSTPQRKLKECKTRFKELADNFHRELNAVSLAAARKQQLQTNYIIGQGLRIYSPNLLNLGSASMTAGLASGVEGLRIGETSSIPRTIESSAVLPAVMKKINTPDPNKDFLGREIALQELHKRLWPTSDNPILTSCALQGMGGVGKTQTALKYVHQYDRYFDKILWVRAEDGLERVRDFCLINQKPGSTAGNDIESAREWLETTDDKWLLVFDNVERFEDIASLWPNFCRHHGSIIITTRTDRLGPKILSTLLINPMDRIDGSRLLFQSLERPESDSNDVDRVLEIAGGLPLIITIVGTYIRQINGSLSDYIQIYDESSAVLWTGRGWKKLWQYENRDEPGKVFQMALKKLPRKSKELIDILAFLNPDDVPKDLLSAPNNDPSLQFLVKPKHNLEDMLFDLAESSLISHSVDPKTGRKLISIHRVLQDYLVYSLSSDPDADSGFEAQLPDAFQKAFKIVRRATPPANDRMQPTSQDREGYEKALPQIISLAAVFKRLNVDGTLDFATLLSDAGMYMWADGLTKNGLQLLKAAEEVLGRINYEGESLTLSKINTVISVLNDNVGISQRREGLLRRESALKDRIAYQDRKAPKDFTLEDDILLHNAWADLACSYLQLHRWKDAEEVWERCLLKYKQWGSPEVEGMAYEYSKYNHHMSFVRIYQGRFDDAVILGRLGVTYMIDSLGKDHPLVWRYKYDLACILLQAGDKRGSLSLHLEMLEIRTTILGRSSEMTLQSCYTVGAVYEYIGNLQEAEFWMKEALQRQRVGKSFWPQESRAIVEFHLSRVLNKLHKEPQMAQELEHNALEIKDRMSKAFKDDWPAHLRQVNDEMVWFEHMLPVFNGRFAGVALLQHLNRHAESQRP